MSTLRSNNDDARAYHHGNLRESLIEEARRVIEQGGTQALTLRDLGERLGVSRTAPYRHFRDRKALLSAVAQRSATDFCQVLLLARLGAGNALARLQAMGQAFLLFAHDDSCGYRLMFQEPELLQEPEAELKQTMNQAFDELRLMVEECQREGVLKAEEPRLMSTYIWSVMHGIATLAMDQRLHAQTDSKVLGDYAQRMLFEGIGVKSLGTLWQKLSQ